MVADIERLIKKKIEIEPFEIEDDRPRRRRPSEDDFARPSAAREAERTAGRVIERAARPASSDPFFDRPYEASGGAESPAWDAAKPAVPLPAKSPNIRPKKKVGSLLGGGNA